MLFWNKKALQDCRHQTSYCPSSTDDLSAVVALYCSQNSHSIDVVKFTDVGVNALPLLHISVPVSESPLTVLTAPSDCTPRLLVGL